ncbi:MAG: NAD(P)/FAD-dependent oxidoreductase, partial [Spirochaetaceae bacterium]|nr:NAD(P)/FAD-dependent oxidoreductase [Spirochaetaceae bacterium]
MTQETFDVTIIGAGAVGTALARELTRYQLDVLVLEASDDVAAGATRANSGIVHGGYAAKAGTRKAEFCRPGNRMFPRLAAELDFPYRATGSVVLCFSEGDEAALERLYANGVSNGVDDLELCSRDETLRRIPRLNPAEVHGGLFCAGAGIVSPYEYAIAMMENAIVNGARLRLESPVTALSHIGERIALEAGGREYSTRILVNAAGVGAEGVAALAGSPPFRMKPRKGQYILLRRGTAEGLDTVVFQPPNENGKGILVTPTTWGNLMLGPDAQEIQDQSDTGTDPESLARIIRTARRSVKDFDVKQAIRVFSGTRPAADRGDFIIEWSETIPGMLHMAGIESPGLTASPALALEAVRLLGEAGLSLRKRPDFQPLRRAPTRPAPLGPPAQAAKRAQLPEGDPERIVCRCEQVSEATVRDALERGIPLRSTDGVKRRTRAGMGACQGAFCGPRVRKLVADFGGIDADNVLGPSRNRDRIKADLDAT